MVVEPGHVFIRKGLFKSTLPIEPILWTLLPEFHLIAECLLWRSLMFVQEDVLVVAAVEATLVGINPAGGVPLLQEVTFTGILLDAS